MEQIRQLITLLCGVNCAHLLLNSSKKGEKLTLRFKLFTFSLSLYSDLRVVKTGGQPLLKFILRYLSRHSRNFSPVHKESGVLLLLKVELHFQESFFIMTESSCRANL